MLEPHQPTAAAPDAAFGSVARSDLEPIRAVIEALPESIFVLDRDGALQLTNPAADRLFAAHPVKDHGDLLSRFEVWAPVREPSAPPSSSAPLPVGWRRVRRPARHRDPRARAATP